MIALCLFFITHPMFQFQNCCSKNFQPSLTQKTWTFIFMLRSLRGYYIHFTGVQNRMSAFETKPNEANMGSSFNKAEFSPLVQCCTFNGTLDSDFYSVVSQSEDLQDKLFSV